MPDAKSSMKDHSNIGKITSKVVGLRSFLLITIPIYFLSLLLLQYQKSDIGGARLDSVFHLNLIRHIALNWNLPDPSNYLVFNIPLWHFIAAVFLQFPSGRLLLSIFQLIIGISTLYMIFKMLTRYGSNQVASIGSAIFAVNSYFVSSSFFPTTDGFAIFTFVLFIATIEKTLSNRVRKRHIVALTFAIAFSVLNRQMFAYLFVIYLIVYFGKRKSWRIFVDLLPAGVLVAAGFILFYIDYCEILTHSSCATVGTFKNIPVISNLSGAGILFSFFILPVFIDKRALIRRNLLILFTVLVIVSVFFLTYGTNQILASNAGSGGSIFLARKMLFHNSQWFDVLSVTTFVLGILLAYFKSSTGRWLIHSASIIWVFSVLGPNAYQRYFEPYLLLLGILFVYSNWKVIFNAKSKLFHIWVFVLFGFQVLEFLLSSLLTY